VVKPQLVVALPPLPPGPAAIRVTGGAPRPALAIPDTAFTVAPAPVVMPRRRGEWAVSGMQAAVGRDGVMYLAFDVTDLQKPLIFTAQALGYPLRFGADDVVIYNRQGFLMQLLVDAAKKKVKPIPGMFVEPASAPLTDSDVLNYSRHEFVTYFLQHDERRVHHLDPNDPNWHADGTPHIDHNQLLLAIAGRVNGGTAPVPGATPPFELRVTSESLFHAGFVGLDKAEVKNTAVVESIDPTTGASDGQGDVVSNGEIHVHNTACIRGVATGKKFRLDSRTKVDGTVVSNDTLNFLRVGLPTNLASLGAIELKGTGQVILGPGSFYVEKIKLDDGARLFVDNSAGPVTLYVQSEVVLTDGSSIAVADRTPEKFALYAVGDKPIAFSGTGTSFVGVLYAPRSSVTVAGDAEFTGAFVAKEMEAEGAARVRYDRRIRRR
jgi:hypothetical protein